MITGIIGGERTPRGGTDIKMLSSDQIKEMQTSGLIYFYPHTDSHPKLTKICDEAVAGEIAA